MKPIQELKRLKEQCESKKENLKELTNHSRGLRIESRRIAAEIKTLTQKIGSLDSQGADGGNNLKGRSTLTQAERDAYQNAFQNIATEHLFETIPPCEEIRSKSIAKVAIDIEFEGVKISFFIGHNTTFRNLRQQAASYWSLPMDEIFFSDEGPETVTQSLLLLDNFVMDEIYVWKRIKLKETHFLLHLVLRNYTLLQDRMNEIFPKEDTQPAENTSPEYTPLNLVSNKKVKVEKIIIKKDYVIKRKKLYFCKSIFQLIFMAGLFLSWSFLTVTDLDINKTTWANKALEGEILWDFTFFEPNNYTIFGHEINSAFMQVVDAGQFYIFLDYLKTVLRVNDTNSGIVSNSLYSLDTVQLRQLRTSDNDCINSYIGNYSCSSDYSWFKAAYKDSLGNYSFQQYQHQSDDIYISGRLSLYPLSGYLLELPVHDPVAWDQGVQELISTKWLDNGTRALFVQMNFVNPSSNLITTIIPFFEITADRVYIPNFNIHSMQTTLYLNNRLIIHLISIFSAVFLIIFEINNNIKLPDEIAFYKGYKKKDENFNYDLLYSKITDFSKLRIWKRFRRASFDEIYSYVIYSCVLALEIISYIWYVTEFKNLQQDSSSHRRIFITLQGYDMINGARALITVLLATNIVRFFILWLHQVSTLFEVILYATSQWMFYLVLCLMPLLAFGVYFFYYLGPYDNSFNSIEKAFVSIIRIFIGDWPSNMYFIKSMDSGYLVLVHFIFMFWRMIILNFQIILFQSKLSLIKKF